MTNGPTPAPGGWCVFFPLGHTGDRWKGAFIMAIDHICGMTVDEANARSEPQTANLLGRSLDKLTF
jgi:hypothetical protein